MSKAGIILSRKDENRLLVGCCFGFVLIFSLLVSAIILTAALAQRIFS